MLDFTQFKFLSFDCYGTLIDWETGILSALRPFLSKHRVAPSDVQILRDYARLESTIQRGPYQSYGNVLREVIRQLGHELDLRPDELELNLLSASLPHWQPFPDTVAALKSLKTRYQLAILSNIDGDLFAGTAAHLPVAFDQVITVQQLKSYKPAIRNFEALLERTGWQPHEILHVAESIYHDVIPARQLGLATVWVHRNNKATISLADAVAGQPDLEVSASVFDVFFTFEHMRWEMLPSQGFPL